MSALIVAAEGLRGSGKTTAIREVSHELASYGLRAGVFDIESAEGATELLKRAKDFPKGHPARVALYGVLRVMQHNEMCQRAAAYDILIADRFWGSSLAFDTYGSGAPYEEVQRVVEPLIDFTDLTLFFEVPATVTLERKPPAGLPDREYLTRVEEGYRKLAEVYGWARIDATKDIETVKQAVLACLLGALSLESPRLEISLPDTAVAQTEVIV